MASGLAPGKREIPTALEFMRARQEPLQGTNYPPGTGGVNAAGRDMPVKGDSKHVGVRTNSSKVGTGHGQQKPASKSRGNGRKQNSLSPNNTKKAGTMVTRGPDSTKKVPPIGAVKNRLRGNGPHGNANIPRNPRTGILSKFEGFGNGRTAGRNPNTGMQGAPKAPSGQIS